MAKAKKRKSTGIYAKVLLRVLKILQEKTDASHPLTQAAIIDILEEEYGLSIERKALSAKIRVLKDAGYSVKEIPRKGVYLERTCFSDAELHFLADTILSNKYITQEETLSLIDRIAQLGSVGFKDRIKHISMIKEMDKVPTGEFFRNVELIDQAKAKERQISFNYYRYDVDSVQKPCKSHVASPYQLFFNNQHYYLLSKNEKKGSESFFRIDRIRDMKILKRPLSDIRTLPSHRGSGINYREIAGLPFLFSDKTEPVRFRLDREMLDQMIDAFGVKNVCIEQATDKTVVGHIRYSTPLAVKCWAQQTIDRFEVLAPASLRESIRAELEKALKKYSAKP